MFITYYSFMIAITAQIYKCVACEMTFGRNMVNLKKYKIFCFITHSQ